MSNSDYEDTPRSHMTESLFHTYAIGVYVYGGLAIVGLFLLALQAHSKFAMAIAVVACFFSYFAQRQIAEDRPDPEIITMAAIIAGAVSAGVSMFVG